MYQGAQYSGKTDNLELGVGIHGRNRSCLNSHLKQATEILYHTFLVFIKYSDTVLHLTLAYYAGDNKEPAKFSWAAWAAGQHGVRLQNSAIQQTE